MPTIIGDFSGHEDFKRQSHYGEIFVAVHGVNSYMRLNHAKFAMRMV